ncbi:hypothetical protein OF83DRAFT_803492 [Amylostereum chailletii]|nr:hypothetical protein OF83DRAFT_803492 [Amylostereum chailletii]
MSLPTPPGTSHKGKEALVMRHPGGHVAWSQENRYHNLASPPRQRIASSASRKLPTRSILKKRPYSVLPLLMDDAREETPEPGDPLADLHYLEWPVSQIIAPNSSLRQLVEAYSILTARIRATVSETTDKDCSWPLFQPLRKHGSVFVEALVRDLGRAMTDPLDGAPDSPVANHGSPASERTALPSPVKSPKKRHGMSEEQVKYARDLCTTTHSVIKFLALIFTLPAVLELFSEFELGTILTHVLAIPLASDIPTPNARKTCALSIWFIQAQRLPVDVLLPAKDRIAYAIRRAIEGELGKEGKKGSVSDGLKAIHDLAIYQPTTFVPAFTELLPSILDCLLAPTLALRAQASHALGGFALASTRVPHSYLHTRIYAEVATFITTTPETPTPPSKTGTPSKTGSPNKSTTLDPFIVRTLRTTLNETQPSMAAQGPVWALSVMASFVVLLGSGLSTSPKLSRILSALLSLAMRHRKSTIRGIGCLVWRCVAWVFFRPPLLTDEDDQGMDIDADDYEPSSIILPQDEYEKREVYWRVVRSVVDMGAGIATIAALLSSPIEDDRRLDKVLQMLQIMIKKGGFAVADAMDVLARLVSSEAACAWKWKKLLPPPLFSPNTGIFLADFTVLSNVVKPIFEWTPGAEHVRPLTQDELATEGFLDQLFDVWREALYCVSLSKEHNFPDGLREGWNGLLTCGIATSQDDDDTLVVAQRVVTILTDMLGDSTLILIQTPETPQAQDPLGEDQNTFAKAQARASSPWRSNAAVKLSVARELWGPAARIIPDEELGTIAKSFIDFLIEKESELVWEEDSPHDAREQWSLLCAEVLLHCSPTWLQSFWGIRGASSACSWDWTPDMRGLVWRTFSGRWRELATSKWEIALQLLGVPFGDRDGWEMSNDDLEAWETTLQFCIDKALDDGVDTARVLDHVAGLISSTHIPTSISSTRVADVLLSHLDINDAADTPAVLLEYVNDTLVSTYPPDLRNKVISMWLVRSITRLVDQCPLSMLQSVLRIVQEGIATWIEDVYEVFTQEEYSFDVLPMYQTVAVCSQSLEPSATLLNTLTPLLVSPFSGRSDKPESVAQAFYDFWNVTYADTVAPPEGWPPAIVAVLPKVAADPQVFEAEAMEVEESVPGDSAASTVNVQSQDKLAPAFTFLPAPVFSRREDSDVVLASDDLPPSPSSRFPSTPPKAVVSFLSSPPHRPSKSASAQREPLLPLSPRPRESIFSMPPSSALSPKPTPQTPSRSPRKDKENASPFVPIASVMERVAMASPTTARLGKRPASDSLDDERPAKKGRMAAPTPLGERHFNSPFVNDDEDDEHLAFEKTQFQHGSIPPRSFYDNSLLAARRLHERSPSPSPSSALVRKRKSLSVAVEVPLLRDVRRRQVSSQSKPPPLRRSLRRAQSANAQLHSQPKIGPPRRANKRVKGANKRYASTSTLGSSPIRALERALPFDSDDSIMASATPSRPRFSLPSSDDEPHFGQVTPRHLVSPAMRRLHDSDPPSDDSNASDSPSRQRVARKMLRSSSRSRSSSSEGSSSPMPARQLRSRSSLASSSGTSSS